MSTIFQRTWKKPLLWGLSFFLLLLMSQGLQAASPVGSNLLWIDLPANARVLTDQASVDEITMRIAAIGIDGIVLDVKAYTGFVAYSSQLAPHISQTRIRNHQGLPEDFDLLQAFVDAARRSGLQLYASINTFSEGNVPLSDGPIFSNPAMASWQSTFLQGRMYAYSGRGHTFVIYGWNEPRREDRITIYSRHHGGPEVTPTGPWGVDVVVDNGRVVKIVDRVIDQNQPVPAVPVNGFVLSGTVSARDELLQLQVGDTVTTDFRTENVMIPASQHSAFTAFVNPILPDVQNYVIAILNELLKYDIDGIVLDRARYANVLGDFSPTSRRAFEAYIGQPVSQWPADVLSERLTAAGKKLEYGPLANQWFHWRAQNIENFFARVRNFVASRYPDKTFGVYVGSWYTHYYSEGVNWGRQGFQPELDWVSDNYHETGYADHLDFLMAGAYYYQVTVREALQAGLEDWRSVEGGLDLVEMAIDGIIPSYGSLFLLDYQNDPEQYRRAIRMVQDRGMGLMLFDLHYLLQYDWWDLTASLLQR